jgi:hypothetical protein
MFDDPGELIDEEDLDLSDWRVYLEYLTYIETKIKKMRQYYYLTHKEAIFSNKLVDFNPQESLEDQK